MFFTISLYVALTVFGLGFLYKVSTWFRYSVDTEAAGITPRKRMAAVSKGILFALFSTRIFTLLKVFLLDILLQVKILKESVLRWFMHMLIFWGFMLLLLMHALENQITTRLFPQYYSTLNP